MIDLFLKLLLAHVLGDFVLQSEKWVLDKMAKKHRSKYLYMHLLVHLSILFVILQFNIYYWMGISFGYHNFNKQRDILLQSTYENIWI